MMPSVELQRFHNALRILLNINFSHLVKAEVITDDEYGEQEWTAFRTNPHRWFISASHEQAERVFALIEARQRLKAEDYYPSHEALCDLVSLLSEHHALNGGGPNWKARWDKALGEAEDIVRVDP